MVSKVKHNAYESLFQNSMDAVVLANPDGTILAANPAACRMLGRSEQEICRIGRSGVADEADPRLAAALAERKRTGAVCAEVNFIRSDGTRFPVEMSSSLFLDSEGKERTALFVRDVSERKRLEQEREQYFNFFMLATDAMCIADPFGCFKHVNPSFVRLTGYTEEELVSKPFLDFVVAEDRQRTADEMKLQVAARPSMQFENRYMCKDGSSVLLSWTAYFDKNDGVTYAVARDVTVLRRKDEQLRHSEDRFRSLVIATSQIVWTTDSHGRVTGDLPDWRAYTGQSVEEIQGDGWASALHPEDLEPTLAVWSEAVKQRRLYDTEYRVRRHDGEYRWFSVRGVPVLDDAQEIREWVGTCSDITERKQWEQELRALAQTDAVTGIANRRQFLSVAEQELSRALRYGWPVSVLMIDIDHFKSVNDSYGHHSGDLVLQNLGSICRESLRNFDCVGRFGGDEFAVILPQADGEQAFEAAERLRQAIHGTSTDLEQGLRLHCTVSIGVATLASKGGDTGANLDSLLNQADDALYEAKRAGRNQVCMFGARTFNTS